ncbi:MAG: hypothetical protein ACOCVZ_04530 [Gemmatimonadota bacterium]
MTRIRALPLFALMLAAALLAGCARAPVEAPAEPAAPDAPRPLADSFPASRARALEGTLPFFYDLYTFQGDSGTTEVVASFAVQVRQLHRERVRAGARYRFNVGLTLADQATGEVHQVHDSVYLTVPDPLPGDHLLHAFVETRVPPSRSMVQRVVMLDAPEPGNGQLYSHPFTIPDYSGPQLMLSDVALGLPGRFGGWRRGDIELALLPGAHFPGGQFDVYYEVYNLPAGHPYTTEIAFTPIRDGVSVESRAVRVRFTGTSDAVHNVLEEHRQVAAPDARGRYWMTVTVTDEETGATVQQAKFLQVRDWGEDATLVPTCPVRAGAARPGCG